MTEKQREGSKKYFHVMVFFRKSNVVGYVELLIAVPLFIGVVYWLITLVLVR
jgi:hypothetical protein